MTDADVVPGFGGVGVEYDEGHQFLGGAGVLEVVIVALRGEDDVAFVGFEAPSAGLVGLVINGSLRFVFPRPD